MNNYLVVLSLFVCQVCICQSRNDPNLSEQRIKELLNDSTVFPRHDQRTADNIPAGVKYTEIRSVDPANPPAIIDIAGNVTNRKAFKLSDIASSVRYIILQPPPDKKIRAIYSITSDDEHIFVNTYYGLYCYSAGGQFLHAPFLNQLSRPEESPPNTQPGSGAISIGRNPFISWNARQIDLLNGKLVFRSSEEESSNSLLNIFDVKALDAQKSFFTLPGELKRVNPEPTYQRPIEPQNGLWTSYIWMDDQSLLINSTLTNIAINGDTLCKFSDYDRPTIGLEAQRVMVPSTIYRLNGQLMLQKSHNDTVFRIIPPNRLLPVYVMKWGDYKPDINQHIAGSTLEGKFVMQKWVETPRLIFIHYTDGRDYPIRRDAGKVKDHWAIYDKTAKTLTHCLLPSSPVMIGNKLIPQIFENNLESVGMFFYPEGVNHRGEMYKTFSKQEIKTYIDSGKFPKEKLQAIYDNMPDESFGLMIVK